MRFGPPSPKRLRRGSDPAPRARPTDARRRRDLRMSNIPLYQEMRQKAGPLWQAIFAHPFMKGMGDGSLSRDRFEFYLKQDYLYLIDFSRVCALSCAKARDLGDMGTLAKH